MRKNRHYATQFAPASAKAVFLFLGARRVLDPCFGWGDRFVGALCTESVEAYHGIDCREAAEMGFQQQRDIYGTTFPDKIGSFTFQLGRSEAVEILGTYDTIFTSPPAFNKEIYPGAPGWSCFEEYYRLFFIPMLTNAWNVLKLSGHLAIHKSDRHGFQVCERMLWDVQAFPGARYLGYIGLQSAQPVGSTNVCSPIWVWKKV